MSPTSSIKFNVDERNEMRKMTILKNRLNGRLFHLNEAMTSIYQKNVSLQNKLDEIHLKGSGTYDPKGNRNKTSFTKK